MKLRLIKTIRQELYTVNYCYLIDNKNNGPFIGFYNSGILEFEGVFVNGQFEYICKQYLRCGKREWIDTNKKDEINGMEIKFNY